jgi:hypothetical protein
VRSDKNPGDILTTDEVTESPYNPKITTYLMERRPMRTQQQALSELCKGFRPFIRRVFIYEWLEDINWHSEAKILCDGFSDPEAELVGHLKKLHIAKNEYNYSVKHFQEFKESLQLEQYMKVLQDIRQKEGSFFINGCFVSPDVIREFERAMHAYNIVAYIYGWGIHQDEFNGHIRGKAFVDELESIINNPDLE